MLKNPITAIINPTGIKRKDAHIIPMYISSKPARIIIAIPKSIKLLPNIIFFIMLFLHNFQICCSHFVFKLYHKTCEQFYRNFGLYEKSPNSFLPGLPHSIVNQFDFHNFLCLCLASVHLPYPFHLVSAFSFSVTPFRFASSGTISSMRFRAASSILVQYCLTYTQLCRDAFCFTLPSQCHAAGRARV